MITLNNSIRNLLATNRFYAEMILQCRRVLSSQCPTAGVAVKGGAIYLAINPAFFNSLDERLRIGVLKHEMLHLLSEHIGRRGNCDPKLWNIAADCAINQFIPEFAGCEQFITLKGLSETCGVTLEPFREADYYYSKLVQAKQEGKLGADGEGAGEPGDDHSGWEDSDPTEVTKELVKAAAKAAASIAGNVPSEAQGFVDRLCASKQDWRAILRCFVGNAEEVIKIETRTRPNRRYGMNQPGHRSEPQLHLAVAVDTSGSVSDEELTLFFSEIDSIARLGTQVTVIEADAAIQACYPYTPGQKLMPKGRGGTAYQPAFDKATELRADAVVYFGDMDCADTPIQPRMPVMWACVRGEPNVPWGRRLRLETEAA